MAVRRELECDRGWKQDLGAGEIRLLPFCGRQGKHEHLLLFPLSYLFFCCCFFVCLFVFATANTDGTKKWPYPHFVSLMAATVHPIREGGIGKGRSFMSEFPRSCFAFLDTAQWLCPPLFVRLLTFLTWTLRFAIVGLEGCTCNRLLTYTTYCHTNKCIVTRHSGSCTQTSWISIMEFVKSWRLLQLKVILTWDTFFWVFVVVVCLFVCF